MKVREMCLAALMTALLCVIAPMSLPVGPIPITLATLGIYLTGALLGMKLSAISVALYILLGVVGLPVFSGFGSGLQKLVSMTGGYLVGYLPCAMIVGYAVDRWNSKWVYPLSMVVGTAVLYTIGTIWFILQTGTGLIGALASCVLPFLPGDAVKIAVASILGISLRKKLSL